MEADFIEDTDGCIEKIHVRNFFCHDNLEVNFNRNVNFIVGRNGSGKSAILIALVVGLGGRASVTNRGSNLSSFIKKGANSATIEIKIKNSSPKAYRHNVYGDHITIVRTINISGGSSYKVKSASGEVKSTKFDEVKCIILAHDIQVDNPISVLNQDDARSFISNDSKNKYGLFRKATNLDLTEDNYLRTRDNCKKAEHIWTKKREACADLEKEYKKWKTSYEELQSRDQVEAKKKSLQNEYYWSEVVGLEQEAAVILAKRNKEKAKMDALSADLANVEQSCGNNTTTIDTLKQQLDEKNLQKTALEQEQRDLESEINTVQSSLRSAENNSGKYTESLNREKRKIVDLEREINNIGSGRAESQAAALEARAATAAQEAAAARARYTTQQHDAQQARQHLALRTAELERAHAATTHHRGILRQKQQQLRELTSRGNDSLAVYGKNMSELCRRVNEAAKRGQFSSKPRGPIGAYLKVKEKKWGGALEHIIGGAMKTFCVNTPEDSRKLFQIMGEVYGNSAKPGVTCSKFLTRCHDVRRTRVVAGHYVSALDALEVNDPVVTNFLIDHIEMEKVLLVPEHGDAINLADTEENVPPNCSKIVTLDSTEYHPAPNYRSYGGDNRKAQFLHLSTDERRMQLEAEIKEAENELRALENQEKELAPEVKKARDNERSASVALQALLSLQHQKDEAERAAVAALDQQQAPQHAVLVDELNHSKEKLTSLQKQVDQLKTKESECRKKINEYESQMKKVKGQLGKVREEYRSFSEEIEHERLKLDRSVTKRRAAQQALKEGNVNIKKVDDIVAEKQTVIAKKVEGALKLCPRIDQPRDMKTIQTELSRIQHKLNAIRSDGLTKAEVAEKLLEVERKYKNTTLMLDRIRKLIGELKLATEDHLKFCYNIQKQIGRRIQHSFQAILSIRNYSGHMDIDYAKGALDIKCSARDGAGRSASSTSSLSGGERSYSTVAFIMSLWDCVELPFCFLDEFDVFMDNVNRKIVMELLIDHALKNTNRQFVLLTPQDASSVTAGPQISIHKMDDPRP